jgi:hypothetical protein
MPRNGEAAKIFGAEDIGSNKLYYEYVIITTVLEYCTVEDRTSCG